jgi:hypothetical protein
LESREDASVVLTETVPSQHLVPSQCQFGRYRACVSWDDQSHPNHNYLPITHIRIGFDTIWDRVCSSGTDYPIHPDIRAPLRLQPILTETLPGASGLVASALLLLPFGFVALDRKRRWASILSMGLMLLLLPATSCGGGRTQLQSRQVTSSGVVTLVVQ